MKATSDWADLLPRPARRLYERGKMRPAEERYWREKLCLGEITASAAGYGGRAAFETRVLLKMGSLAVPQSVGVAFDRKVRECLEKFGCAIEGGVKAK